MKKKNKKYCQNEKQKKNEEKEKEQTIFFKKANKIIK